MIAKGNSDCKCLFTRPNYKITKFCTSHSHLHLNVVIVFVCVFKVILFSSLISKKKFFFCCLVNFSLKLDMRSYSNDLGHLISKIP